MDVLVVGYYGFRNLGDEAILSSMLVELGEALPSSRFVVTSGEPALTAAQHSVGAIHWRDIPAMVRAVEESDLVVLGGGGLFHDLWGFPGETLLTADHWGIPFFAGPAVLAAMHGKPIALYAVGVEAIADPEARQVTRAVFEMAWAASVRDEVSASFVRGLGVDSSRYTVTADPAWLLSSGRRKKTSAQGVENGLGRPPRIGVALRGWNIGVDPEIWMGEVAASIEEFARATGAKVVMIPFQVLAGEAGYDDRKVAEEIIARFEDPALAGIAPTPLDGRAAVEVFRDCDLVLGMRYHSLLCAALAEKPVVGLAYAPKVQGVMSQLGMEDLCFPVSEVSREQLGGALRNAWESRSELERALKRRTEKLIEAGRQTSRLISDLASGKVTAPPETPAAKALLLESSVGAVVRAATRTAEVLNLVSERDGAGKRREELERQHLELRVRHENLEKERDGLADRLRDSEGRREDLDRRLLELTVWHEGLKKERDGLERRLSELQGWHEKLKGEHEKLKGEHDGLQEGHKALEAAYHDLKRTFDEIVSSKLYAVLSSVWRIRRGLRGGGGRSARANSAIDETNTEDDLKSWERFAFERFKEAMRRRFSGISEPLRSRGPIGSVSVVVLVETPDEDLQATLESLQEQQGVIPEVVVVVPEGAEELCEKARRLMAACDGTGAEVLEALGAAPVRLWEGIRRCSGDAILWLRAGDLAHPVALRRMVQTLEKSDHCGGVCAAYDAAYGSPREDERTGQRGDGRTESPDLCVFNVVPSMTEPPWVALVRREVLDLIGPPGDLVGTLGLTDFIMRMNDATELGVISGDPVLFVRQAAAQGSSGGTDMSSLVRAMAVFDDFRRNLMQSRVLWSFTVSGNDGARAMIERLTSQAKEDGDVVDVEEEHLAGGGPPRLWVPSVLVRVETTEVEAERQFGKEGGGGFLVTEDIGTVDGDNWDLRVTVRPGQLPEGESLLRTWHVRTESRLVGLIRLLAMFRHFRNHELESARWIPEKAPLQASVIVCTHRPIPPLEAAMKSLAGQKMDPEDFEVLVVNNAPESDALRQKLEEIEERHFPEGGVVVRNIMCPAAGLSHARNAGIAAAKGEILLFLDDDAVAADDWVSTAVSLFDDNPDFGIIGGYIRLVPPEPRPSVIQPGWERYWSQYLGEKESLYEVTDWWDYPWGASWCARRSVLLRIGGFRVGYGRTRGDYAGGEEVVAASLAARLGWKIGVAPELEVEHRVIAERFTWKHVKKTLMVGTLGNYRMQRDLYIPMDGIDWTVRSLLSPSVDRTVGANSVFARMRHWSYRKRAWARLFAVQLRDRRDRRKPARYGGLC